MTSTLQFLTHDISPEDSFRVEHAVQFLVTHYAATGHNPKPVILHSLRVAMYLLELCYETNLIIAAVLHDLTEDTAVTGPDIEREFGHIIAGLVEAVSYRSDITDPVAQYQEMFRRTVAAGREAVVIKAADIHSNSLYIPLVQDPQKRAMLIQKIKSFLDVTGEFKDEAAVKNLARKYDLIAPPLSG